MSPHAIGWLSALLLAVIVAAAIGSSWAANPSARPPNSAARNKTPWPPDNPRRRLTDKLLDLDTIKVDDIMIPRSEIASIDIGDDWDTIIDTLRAPPHAPAGVRGTISTTSSASCT